MDSIGIMASDSGFQGHYWSVDVHSSESFGEVHAYVLRKRRRARTRAAVRGEPMEIVVKCHDH